MNTIKKLLVATVSSIFVFASATAGELSLSGSIEISSNSAGNAETGNRFGYENEYTIAGATELDNGMGVSYKATIGDTFAENDTEITFTTDYGAIALTSMYDAVDSVDNIVPTAFEEAEHGVTVTDAGNLGTNSVGIKYSPTIDLGGMSATLFYTPKWGTGDGSTDEAGTGTSGAEKNEKAYSVILAGNPLNLVDGLGLTVGYEVAEQNSQTTTGAITGATEDAESATAAITYAYGNAKIGYQMGVNNLGYEGNAKALTDTTATHYKNTSYGIAYAVNDALTVSYQRTESDKHQAGGDTITQEADGFSAAYTMGGMTISYFRNDADNASYTRGTNEDNSGVVISVAF